MSISTPKSAILDPYAGEEVKREARTLGREIAYIEITEEEQRELCRKKERLFTAYSGNWKCSMDCHRCRRAEGQTILGIRARLEPKAESLQRNFDAARRVYEALVAHGLDPLKYMKL